MLQPPWDCPRTDPDVYVNHASIQEALGFSTVKDQDLQMPKGYKQPLNKQSLIRLMKSLLKTEGGREDLTTSRL